MPTSRLGRAFEAFASLVLAALLLLAIPSMALAGEQSFALGSVVNAGLDTGYSESNEIKESDPHFGWQLGSFNVKGFTSVQRGGESATFLKTVGDKVSLELSPYDLTKGRITFRHIEGRPAAAPAQNNQNRRR